MVMCHCGCSISRSVIKVINGLFLLISLGIMGFGGYLFTTDAMDWIGNGIAVGLICFGGFVFLLSLLGLFSAKDREDTICIGDNKCLMGVYSTLLLILILAQIAVAIVVLVAEDDAEQFLQDRWNDMSFEQQDNIMQEFECGPYSPTFGEHLDHEELGFDVDENELTEEMKALFGQFAIEVLRELVHPVLNSTDPTTICKVDEFIEKFGHGKFAEHLGVPQEALEDGMSEPTDICFQDCYETFKDEFMTLGNVYIALLATFACMEIFLLVAACCALFNDDEKFYA